MLGKRLTQLCRFFSAERLEAPRKYSEKVSRARHIMDLYNLNVFNQGRIFIAPNATVVGDVFLGSDISIWHGTVIRGDINRITLTKNIVIGNNCVLHTAATSPTGLGAELYLGGNNVIQNNCTLYSCRIESGAYIGHNSVIMEGAVIKKGAIIAPNSVVPPGRIVKERQVWGGNPIKFIRKALEQESFVTFEYSRHVNILAANYNDSFLPYNNAYLYLNEEPEAITKNISLSTQELEEINNHYDPSEATGNRYL